ncbi:DNA recombination protein RmuC [Cellulomonas hominis]
MEILGVLVGLALGAGLGWWSGRLSASGHVAEARRLTAQSRDVLADRDRVAAERDALRADLHEADVQVATLAARIESERASSAARLEQLQQDQQVLGERFDVLATRALEANNERFLAVAEQRLRRSQEVGASELGRREEAVRLLVEPLSVTLAEVRAEVSTAEKARAEAHAALGEQVRAMREAQGELRSETHRLVSALRAPQVRGRWGELQLRRVVEASGMVEHVDFEEQEHVATADGALRPDMVVKLPDGKNIVVDAKVAFSGYLEAMEAPDDATRTARLIAHARHMREHIDSLGRKAYWEHFTPTPEFVVMFVPAEPFLNAAFEADPTLQERAFDQNVVIATPATLVALLRTVGYTWRQESLAAGAQEVLRTGKELHARLSTMGGHLTRLGRSLDSAVGAYNQSVSSLESRVLVTARRLADLKVVDGPLDAPAQIDRVARRLQAPELTEGPELTEQPALTEGWAELPAVAD